MKQSWVIVLLGVGLAICLIYGASLIAAHPYTVLIGAFIVGVTLARMGQWKLRLPCGPSGATKSWAQAFVGSTVVGVLMYILLSFLFAGAFGSLVAVGPWAVLTNPAAMGREAAKVAIVLFASYCTFWVWFQSKKEHLWLYRLAIVVSVLSLIGMSLQGYSISKMPEDQQRRLAATDLTREGVLRYFESNLAKFGWTFTKKAGKTGALEVGNFDIFTMPDTPPKGMKIFTAEVNGKTVRMLNPETPLGGTQWIIHYDIQFPGENSGMQYIQIIARDDENIIRYIRQDYLYEVLNPTKPSVLVAKSGTEESPTEEASAQVVPTVLKVPVMLPTVPAQMVNEDVITINEKAWADTEIIPEAGDVVDVRAGNGSLLPIDSLKKVMIRSGAAPVGTLVPNSDDDKLAYGQADIVGNNPPRVMPDGTTRRAVLRLKLSEPGTLFVKVARTKKET